jgi:hypothetical protein
MSLHRFWSLCPALLLACGGDMTGLQGIYTIDSWTHNDTACDVEGDSILESKGQTALYVKVETFITAKFVNVVPCTDTAECEEMAGDSDTIHLGQWGFDEGSDGNGWRNVWYSAFEDFDDDTQCDGTRHEDQLLEPADGSLRVETRSSQTVQFAKPGGISDCFDIEDNDLEDLVGEPPCNELEVLAATFAGGLP